MLLLEDRVLIIWYDSCAKRLKLAIPQLLMLYGFGFIKLKPATGSGAKVTASS